VRVRYPKAVRNLRVWLRVGDESPEEGVDAIEQLTARLCRRRLPFRRCVDQGSQLVPGPIVLEPVASVALFSHAGEWVQQPDRPRDTLECCRNRLCMISTWFVIIGDNRHVAASQRGGVRRCPFTRATVTRGGRKPRRFERMDTLLAFYNDNQTVGRNDLGKPVQNRSQSLKIPQPAAVSVGTPLTELFRGVPDGLIDQYASGIEVIVGGLNPARLTLLAFWFLDAD